MTERDDRPSGAISTAEIPLLTGAWDEQGASTPATADVPEQTEEPNVVADLSDQPSPPYTPPPNATVPVTERPAPRLPRRGPLTIMGPWAPVAGGGLGLLLGLVIVLAIGGSAVGFSDRLALAFVVLGLGMLGTAGILLADEVSLLRRRARDAVVRPQWVEATADLLNGLTPARLLLMSSGFVLFLAALLGR